MLNADEIGVHQLISVLARTRMPVASKGFVIKCRRLRQENGALPTRMVFALRALYRKHSKRIRSDEEARERGRMSMAKEKLGMTEAEVRARRKAREDELRRKVEDFGI